MITSDRSVRMRLSCAIDGGEPAVAELVQNLGAEGAWAKIIEGVLGEPAAQRAASGHSAFRRTRRRRVAGRA
jgi:DNA processing protein